IVTDPALRWWALGLVAATTYAYLYSDLVVRRIGVYVYLAAFTLLWGEVLAIDLLHLAAQPIALIVALSLTGLIANLIYSRLRPGHACRRRRIAGRRRPDNLGPSSPAADAHPHRLPAHLAPLSRPPLGRATRLGRPHRHRGDDRLRPRLGDAHHPARHRADH